MALFKIKKGVKANLPTSYVEGYCYFTTDDGKFYIDTSTTASGRICLNAGTADKLTSNAGSATQPIYFSGGKPVAITGNIANGTTGNAATATKLATARTISLAGSVTGSGSFDGSNNLSITTTTNHSHNTLSYGSMLTSDSAIDSFHANNVFQAALWNNTSYPGVSNGIILDMGWYSTIYGAQIAIDDDPSYFMALRQRDGDGWKAWKRIPMADGTGASGTWDISITGNAATASKVNDVIPEWSGSVTWADTSWIAAWNADGTKIKALSKDSFAAANHTHSYLPLSGGIMYDGARISHAGNLYIGHEGNIGWIGVQDICSQESLGDGIWSIRANGNAIFQTCKGAVWNDYAEFRICNEDFKPGQVVLENGDDTLSITNQRLQRGCSIISDTFGFAIGETDEAKCPIAVSGRVLAYGYEPREEFEKHIGWPVCSGPNGTVSIMTEEEEEKYPSRIIGIISAVPEYDTWGTGNVKVDGRIWIKVK